MTGTSLNGKIMFFILCKSLLHIKLKTRLLWSMTLVTYWLVHDLSMLLWGFNVQLIICFLLAGNNMITFQCYPFIFRPIIVEARVRPLFVLIELTIMKEQLHLAWHTCAVLYLNSLMANTWLGSMLKQNTNVWQW